MRRRAAIVAIVAAPAVAPAQPQGQRASDAIPFRRESAPPGFDGGRWAAGVLAAAAVGAGALWWMRRRLPGAVAGPQGRRMRVVETLRISPRSTLLLVEVDGRTLLIGEQPGAITVLPVPAEARGD